MAVVACLVHSPNKRLYNSFFGFPLYTPCEHSSKTPGFLPKRMNVESTSEYITSISIMTVKLEINLRPESRSVAPGPQDYPHNETCS